MEKNRISFSQFSMWNTCPHKWKLSYIDKIKDDTPSIHLIFGKAMHYVIQMYLVAMFANGVQYAEQLDLLMLLKETMAKEYLKSKKNYFKQLNKKNVKENVQLELFEKSVAKIDMVEFYYDGVKIIKEFKKHRGEFFNLVDEELINIEFELSCDLKENLFFIAFIDILLKNKKTGKLRIIDLKTSTKGWGLYKKRDTNTTDQLVLYKAFYAKKYNMDINKIDVEFIILKRKLYEDIPYKQKRIIRYVPASGKPTINRTMERMNNFINHCFDSKGNFMPKNTFYPKIPTKSNCRFCPFNSDLTLCDKKNEV